MEGPKRQEGSRIEIPAGTRITITKKSLQEGKDSVVAVGESTTGILLSPVAVGSFAALDNGLRTSTIRNVRHEGGKTFITTHTSLYEISPEFNGLTYHSETGDITLPRDAHIAPLREGNAPLFEAAPSSSVEAVRVKIDREALQGVLLEVGGGVVHAIDERYFVLAKVGNAHIPFYRSSNGTSGKKRGAWYPFFGHTGSWVIKGDIQPNGKMPYHPEITRVNDLLNEHLTLPDPRYVDTEYKLRTKDGRVLYDINKEIPMRDMRNTPEWKERGMLDYKVKAYVERMTGYAPHRLDDYHPYDGDSAREKAAREWISAVVTRI